jgi:hypothetical protein
MSSEGQGPRSAGREYILHLLTEAAEIEHNLLCSYLYAAFSLRRAGEGPSEPQMQSIDRWRQIIIDVAIQEMGHLVLVNNLIVALGGAATFSRPNFPVAPGYHPAGFTIRLTPFTQETLKHFIFLERPEDSRVRDSKEHERRDKTPRTRTTGDLAPSTPDYDTIGELYAEIRAAIVDFASRTGEAFVARDGAGQVGPDAAALPGLLCICNVDDAITALNTIVEQGEGAESAADDCHFSRFMSIQAEWASLESVDPRFAPAHPAAHDPVMRRPAANVERVWITNPPAAERLDFGNALYALTVRLLEQAYAPASSPAERKGLLEAAIALMHALSTVGEALARLPAGSDQDDGSHAGLTFAVPRNARARAGAHAVKLLRERLEELQEGASALFGGAMDGAFVRAEAALAGMSTLSARDGPAVVTRALPE